MSRYKVSYGRCKKSTFSGKVNKNQLVPGRLYFVKDTGQIMRADSENTYTEYTNNVHVINDWPANFIEDHIYLKKIAIKEEGVVVKTVVRGKIEHDGVQYEIQCSGGGGGSSGDISELATDVENLKLEVEDLKADVEDLKTDMEDVKDRLTWK